MASFISAATLPALLGAAQTGLGLAMALRRDSLDAKAAGADAALAGAEQQRRFAADERQRHDELRRALAARRAAAAAGGVAPLEGSGRVILDSLIARSLADSEEARAALDERLGRLGLAGRLARQRGRLAIGRDLLATAGRAGGLLD